MPAIRDHMTTGGAASLAGLKNESIKNEESIIRMVAYKMTKIVLFMRCREAKNKNKKYM